MDSPGWQASPSLGYREGKSLLKHLVHSQGPHPPSPVTPSSSPATYRSAWLWVGGCRSKHTRSSASATFSSFSGRESQLLLIVMETNPKFGRGTPALITITASWTESGWGRHGCLWDLYTWNMVHWLKSWVCFPPNSSELASVAQIKVASFQFAS